MTGIPEKRNTDWIDGLKAFAILGILLNHSVESFHYMPWFSNKFNDSTTFLERIISAWPSSGSLFTDIVIFLGWLGDMGPGIFILLSGLTLTLSALNRNRETREFYLRRAQRIYPLYISIHLIILVFAIVIFRWQINIFSFKTIFSLAGLRFNDSLFFYINPSWWFIWLILQMYLLFPFLFKLMNKKGRIVFLIVTLALTLVSRFAGLIGLTYSHSLYYWNTGLFGGTRLFEFTAGMMIGSLIHENNPRLLSFMSNKTKVFISSLIIYVSGLLCSLSQTGSLISYILITIGLSGVLYSLYFLLCSSVSKVKKILTWVGKNSFSVFLLHQPFMIYAASELNKGKLVIALFLIAFASFIAGYYIEKAVNAGTPYILNSMQKCKTCISRKIAVSHIFILLFIPVLLSFTSPFLNPGNNRLFYIITTAFLLIAISLIFILRTSHNFRTDSVVYRILDVALIISTIYIILTHNWLPLYWLFLLSAVILILISSGLNYFFSLGLTYILIFTAILSGERFLQHNKPLEVRQWGELPALQTDEITGYSLIPSRETHLKYNAYDYIVRTNRLGFTSPDIKPSKEPNEFRIFTIGDAFTMPEGMKYESSYPFLLEKELTKTFPDIKITVINGGVTGYGPNEFYAHLQKYIDTVQADLVINQFFINEFQEINYEPGSRNSFIGFDFKKHSLRQYYLGNRQLPAHYLKFIRNLFNFKDKTYSYRKSLLEFYEKDSDYYSDTVLIKIDNYFNKISDLCSEKGSELLVMFVPGQIAVSDPVYISDFPSWVNLSDTTIYSMNKPNHITKAMCLSKGITFADITDTLRKHKVQPVYFPESWHWNKEGHIVAAGYLSDIIKKMNFFVDKKSTDI